MKKKHLIFVPLALILFIQILDKKNNFVLIQYLLLATMIIATIIKFLQKK